MTGFQSVVKALDVLEAVSALGVATVGKLSYICRVPKPTIVRLLHTLVTCGYIRQISPRSGYCLTSRLATIGMGFAGVASLLEAGIPVTDAITEEIRWPIAIATFEDTECVVRYSTIPKSPYAHACSTIGKLLPLSSSAHGKATLAHLPPKRTAALLAQLRRGEQEVVDENALQLIRIRGYAVRTPGRDPATNTIAVPIFNDEVIVATLGVTFFANAVPLPDFEIFGKILTQASSVISKNFVSNADESVSTPPYVA